MSKVFAGQLRTNHVESSPHSKKGKIIVVWTVQVMLALLFLFAGSMKLILPIEVMASQMPVYLPSLFLRFIGICEVAGAVGLILPQLLRIRPVLTPLAACGLILIMTGATIITLIGGSVAGAMVPLVVGLLCAYVVYGRRRNFARA